jgi:hypothetical protein
MESSENGMAESYFFLLSFGTLCLVDLSSANTIPRDTAKSGKLISALRYTNIWKIFPGKSVKGNVLVQYRPNSLGGVQTEVKMKTSPL